MSIDGDNVATITPPSGDWIGSETIIFTATDVTANAYNGSDGAIFTRLALDHPPEVGDIPDQTIGIEGTFTTFDLDDYLTELDGDNIEWSFEFQVTPQGNPDPSWSVNPADYSLSMSITALVKARGHEAQGSNHILAAFAGSETRGTTQAVAFDDGWLYFLTVYANGNGEALTFQFYDAEAQETLPVDETLNFTASAMYGNPINPFVFNAGYLQVIISPGNLFSVNFFDDVWTGSETVVFTASDVGTFHEYSDSDPATFTVLGDHSPQVSGIPDQVIETGDSFAVFDLDDYLTELDEDDINWSYSGNVELSVSIDGLNRVTVTPPGPEWIGEENLTFSATDVTANGFTGSDEALFQVIPDDYPPEVGDVPDQTIEQGQTFNSFDLDDFFTELDGDAVAWSYEFQPPAQTDPIPGWSINPADYQFSMNLTAIVTSRGEEASGSAHTLAAFSGVETRGLTTGVEFSGNWLYFLTVYSDSNGQEISFRFYDAASALNLPVQQTLTFTADAVYGQPISPYELQAGFMLLEIDDQQVVTLDIVDADWSGSELIRFIATDLGTLNEHSGFDEAAFTILEFDPGNDPPIANDEAFSTDEDIVLAVAAANGVLANDTDIEHDPLTANVVVNPANGILSLNENGSFTYTPNQNFNGTDTFTYRANDGSDDSNTATVTIVVNPINDAPLAGDDAYAVDEDNTLTVDADSGVLDNDIDAETDPLTATLIDNVSHGALTLNGDGSFIYTPVGNYNGSDSFTYWANDGTTNSDTATVTITVNNVNDVPVAVDDDYVIAEDNTLDVNAAAGLLANDTDIDLDPLIATQIAAPLHGTLSLNPDGSFSYTPFLNFAGIDTFIYVARDGEDDSNRATVVITVNAVNDAPVADGQTVNTDEDTPVSITLTGSDIEGDPLGFTIKTLPINGSLAGTAPNLIYTPNSGYFGQDQFAFTVDDGQTESPSATVTININEADNTAPIADDQSLTTDEDVAVSVTLTGSDHDGDGLTYSLATQPSHGVLSGAAPDLIYTPEPDYNGSDSFTFITYDGTVGSDPATVAITINPINDAPIANDQNLNAEEDTPALFILTGSDIESDPLTFAVETQPINGSLSGAAPNLIYTPSADYNGSDSFTFTTHDGTVGSDPGTVSITVNPVNDVPTADDQSVIAIEDTPLAIIVTGGDVDNDPLAFIIVTEPANGSLSGILPDLIYTPEANYNGSDSFVFIANDGQANSNPATVSMQIDPVNDAPVADDQIVNTEEDTPVSITLTGSDIEGEERTSAV
ncbi:MAG: tandem-95 repeat protein [Planctomycetes bacterium]|nr:tandem-95 repeat protein [Planctomycetota bacterium]